MMCSWRLEDNLRKLVVSFHLVGTREGTQVVVAASKSLYLLTHGVLIQGQVYKLLAF